MKDYLKQILEPLLRNPQALEISESQDEEGKLLSVYVSSPDMGRVIGKSGETIKAIRTIVHGASILVGEKVSIKINEPRTL